jgi:micrococcal nuclease
MKNRTYLYIVFLFTGFSLFALGKAQSPAPGPVIETVRAVSGETVVHVTNSGSKYHNEGCSALRSSAISVSLADAVHSGYEPCSLCNPPLLNEREASASTQPAPDSARAGSSLYQVNKENPRTCETVDFSRLVRAEVVGHVDGDTVRVRITNPPDGLSVVETIRFLGVDTPETVHPQKEVERFGKEASEFTKSRLLGKNVYLAFDWDIRDRFGRILAYVYMENKTCHNANIIREGYGFAYTKYNFRFMEEFRSYEKEAKDKKRGLWAP